MQGKQTFNPIAPSTVFLSILIHHYRDRVTLYFIALAGSHQNRKIVIKDINHFGSQISNSRLFNLLFFILYSPPNPLFDHKLSHALLFLSCVSSLSYGSLNDRGSADCKFKTHTLRNVTSLSNNNTHVRDLSSHKETKLWVKIFQPLEHPLLLNSRP